MGGRLIAGRDLTWTETYNQTSVALVSENLARELWRDPRAALGKRIRSTLKDDWSEIIGVLADERENGVDQKAPTTVYWPLLQKNFEGDGTSGAPQRGFGDPHAAGGIHQPAARASASRLERQSKFAAGQRENARRHL